MKVCGPFPGSCLIWKMYVWTVLDLKYKMTWFTALQILEENISYLLILFHKTSNLDLIKVSGMLKAQTIKQMKVSVMSVKPKWTWIPQLTLLHAIVLIGEAQHTVTHLWTETDIYKNINVNIKRLTNITTVKKPYICVAWGKVFSYLKSAKKHSKSHNFDKNTMNT